MSIPTTEAGPDIDELTVEFSTRQANALRRYVANRLKDLVRGESPKVAISPRRMQVLQLMCGGVANKRIATAMGISLRTVEAHRTAMMKQTGCKTTCELGVWASKRGLIEGVARDNRGQRKEIAL